jgi:hypothetical protein
MFMIDLGQPSHYSVLQVSPDAEVAEVRAGLTKVAGILARQLLKARTPEEKKKIQNRQVEINRIGSELSNPRSRTAYDRANVHLTFFSVRKATAPVFEERELLLRWMHQSVRDFLLARQETIEPITDLERTDFSADFSANELLERLLRAAPNGGQA